MPANPINMTLHLKTPTFSPNMGTERMAVKIGIVKSKTVALVAGNIEKAVKAVPTPIVPIIPRLI